MYDLYADGACQPNPGVGGWAFLLHDESESEVIESGYEPDSTNNRMELTAVLNGLQYFNQQHSDQSLRISLDSNYVLEGIKVWSHNWKKYGWQKKNGDAAKNLDLWKQIREEVDKITTVEYNLVKGHSGQRENTICDKVAVQEIKKYNARTD